MRAAARLSTAIGQILRQKCGATSRVNGTSGTMTCQNRSSDLTPRHQAFVARLAATPTTANTATQRARATNRFTASSLSKIPLCLAMTSSEKTVQSNGQTSPITSSQVLDDLEAFAEPD